MPLESAPISEFSRAAYHFNLPPDLIAQEPAAQRDDSRLLVVDRDRHDHRRFSDLPALVEPSDLLVLNATTVRPAQFFAQRQTGGRVELLLVRLDSTQGEGEALLGARRPIRDGETLWVTVDTAPKPIEIVSPPLSGGVRRVRFPCQWLTPQVLARIGQMPLPPYIRRNSGDPRLKALDAERYQTVYAQHHAEQFSVAAPTAGLHFTTDLLARTEAACQGSVRLTLEVGIGTFQPVRADDLREHRMHGERFFISADSLRRLCRHREAGGALIAVGTTSARVLETLARMGHLPLSGMRQSAAASVPPPESSAATPFATLERTAEGIRGETCVFIHPPQPVLGFDKLITNFHLPESTLLMLVAALIGRERVLALYAEAVRQQYRFFSYGDAMFVRHLASGI